VLCFSSGQCVAVPFSVCSQTIHFYPSPQTPPPPPTHLSAILQLFSRHFSPGKLECGESASTSSYIQHKYSFSFFFFAFHGVAIKDNLLLLQVLFYFVNDLSLNRTFGHFSGALDISLYCTNSARIWVSCLFVSLWGLEIDLFILHELGTYTGLVTGLVVTL